MRIQRTVSAYRDFPVYEGASQRADRVLNEFIGE